MRDGISEMEIDILQNVINQFTRIGQDERVRFLGNVNVGQDIQLIELRQIYSAVSRLLSLTVTLEPWHAKDIW